MGLFNKKSDPLAQRANSLNRRIAELEAEIAKLNQSLKPPSTRGESEGFGSQGIQGVVPASRPTPTPKAPIEPVFERMPPRPLDAHVPESPGREAVELGLRRPVWSQWWRRFKRQFVDPPPANEKLVNYLAAGGIQGLRPLRYERRVARNRIIFICVVLGLVLWGILIVFWQTR